MKILGKKNLAEHDAKKNIKKKQTIKKKLTSITGKTHRYAVRSFATIVANEAHFLKKRPRILQQLNQTIEVVLERFHRNVLRNQKVAI